MLIALLLLYTVESYIHVPIKLVPGARKVSRLPSSVPLDGLTQFSNSVGNNWDYYYDAMFNFGTPAQAMSLVLDTGSSWTWVPRVSCACHYSENRFNSTKSSTLINTGKLMDLYYGLGEVHGYLCTDTVEVEGLRVLDQPLVLATSDGSLDGLESDGILGLGFSGLSDGYPTFVQNLKAQGEIDSAVFSLYLNHWDNAYMESAMTIGGFDAETYGQGQMTTINIISYPGFWMSSVSKLIVAGNQAGSENTAIFDTGTSYIYGPNDLVDFINDKISSAVGSCGYVYWGEISCLCSIGEYSLFPDIELKINGVIYKITPESYLSFYGGYCYPMLSYSYDSYWLIGSPFFREFYTVHDMDHGKIYAWKAKSNADTTLASNSQLLGSTGAIIFAGLVGASIYIYRRAQDPFKYSLLA